MIQQPDPELASHSYAGQKPGMKMIHVVITAGAAVGSTGVLRRRMAAEMRVMIRPTGRGSMKV